MTWQFFVLIAVVFWAIGQIFIRKGFSRVGVFDTYFMGGIWGLLLYLPYILLHLDEVHPDLFLLVWSSLIILGYLVYYKALSVGNFSINVTVASTFPLFTILLAQVFLDEPLSIIQWFGVGIILSGVVALSYIENGGFSWEELKKSHLKWPVWAAIYLGWGDFMAKFIEDDYSNNAAVLKIIEILTSVSLAPFQYLSTIVEKTAHSSYSHATIFFCFGFVQLFWGVVLKALNDGFSINIKVFKSIETMSGNFFLSAGTVFFYLALFSGWASLVVPISASHIIFAVLLARIFLAEKLRKSQYILIALIILGNILVNL